MERRIDLERPVRAQSAAAGRALMTDPAALFAPMASGAGTTGDTLLIDLGAHAAGGASAGHAVDLTLSAPRRTTDGGVAVELSWRPVGHGRFLPSFSGVLHLVPDGHTPSLCLSGAYRPPLGPLGSLFDGAIGRRVARRTLEEAFGRIAERLESVVGDATRGDPYADLYVSDLRGWPGEERAAG